MQRPYKGECDRANVIRANAIRPYGFFNASQEDRDFLH